MPVGSDQHREVVIAMATFSVEVVVGNPDTTARETVDALVDTGATFSIMPASLLGRLGIEPTKTRRLRLANGEVEECQTGMAILKLLAWTARPGCIWTGRPLFAGSDHAGRPVLHS